MLHGYNFAVYIKTDDFYIDTVEDIETRFGTSNYELERQLPREINKKIIGLMSDELSGKLMTEFANWDQKHKAI